MPPITQIITEEAKNPRNLFRGDDVSDQTSNYDAMMRNYAYQYMADITFMVKMNSGIIEKIRWYGAGSIYSLAYASYLSGIIGGMTILEAQAVTTTDIETAYGVKWPRLYNRYKLPVENALRNTLTAFQKNLPF